jgi:hypothetical protein
VNRKGPIHVAIRPDEFVVLDGNIRWRGRQRVSDRLERTLNPSLYPTILYSTTSHSGPMLLA